MKKKLNTLVFIYNSFNDPLFQNLVLSYIKTLSTRIHGDYHIITFEQPAYAMTSEERKRVNKELAMNHIYWHPLSFHTGRFLLVKKAWDFMQAFFLVLKLRFKYRTQVIFSFANVASAIAIILKKLLRMKMIIYSYEPHSEFMADLGYWDRNGLKFRVLHYLETLAGKDADFVMTGTSHMVDKLKASASNARLFRAPTAVDADDFQFNLDGRISLREKLNVDDKQVFLYLGKFGGLYYTHEIPAICVQIIKEIPNAFFLVVTSNAIKEVNEMYAQVLNESDFYVTGNLTYMEVKEYISAADVGISGVPPSPSQKYRSPTKVAEYLLCGLPYITTTGVSEDDEVALANEVGVVIDHFGRDQLPTNFINQLHGLLTEDKELIRTRCREVGLEYRSKERIDEILYSIYKKLMVLNQ